MQIHRIVAVVFCFMILGSGCAEEPKRSPCRFLQADIQAKLEEDLIFLDVVRRDTDPNAIYILDYSNVDDEKHTMGAARLDLASSRVTSTALPIDDRGRVQGGYIHFEAGTRKSDFHPMIGSGLLRYEYLGHEGRQTFLQRNVDGKWSVDHEPRFTGTRRMIYGTRALLEQDFTNAPQLGHIYQHVQIDPNGSRIVSMCTEPAYTWIGVFSRAKLDEQQKRPSK